MYATAIPGAWKKALWRSLAVVSLWACAYLFSPLAPLMALALPLAVCPAFAQGYAWFALALPLAPATAWFAAGGDPVLGLLIPLCPYLCLLANVYRRRYRLSLHGEAVACAGAFAVGAVGMLLRLSALLGGSLFPRLAETAVGTVQNSITGGNVLYSLVSVGYLTVPAVYADSAAIKLGNLILIAPSLKQELLNMLRLRLTEGLTDWVPSLLIQGAVLVGVFSALFAARARAKKSGDASPRFAAFSLSRAEQGAMLALCLVTLLAALAGTGFPALLSSLAYTGFSTVYQLLGAAVVVALLSGRRPKRTVWYGILAAVLYVVLPIGLFMLGMVDQFVHLRGDGPQLPKEE
jgi:hypothetical protein